MQAPQAATPARGGTGTSARLVLDTADASVASRQARAARESGSPGRDPGPIVPHAGLGARRLGPLCDNGAEDVFAPKGLPMIDLSLIHISEPTRLGMISY